MKTNTL